MKDTGAIQKQSSDINYHSVVDNAPFGYQSLDENGCVITVNSIWLDTLGYRRDQVEGKWFGEFLPNHLRESFQNNYPENLMYGDPIKGIEFTLLHSDGSEVDVEYTSRGEINEHGQFLRSHCVFQDVTERKLAQGALKLSRKKYRDLVEHINDAIFALDSNGTITYISDPVKKLLGYDPVDLIGDNFKNFVHPDDVDLILSRFEALQRGRIKPAEYRLSIRGGGYCWVRTSSSPIFDGSKFIGVRGVVTDMHESMLGRQKIISSKREWEEIFQGIGNPAIILDLNHVILKANTAALNLTGLRENELLGKKCFEIFHGTTESAKDCPMVSLLKRGTQQTVEMETETLGGTFLITCTPLTNDDEDVDRVIHIFTDLSETKEAEKQLRRSQKLDALGTLSGGIAHEFNNILAIILGNAELLSDEITNNQAAIECIDEIQSASVRAKEVVQKLLSIGRSHQKPQESTNIGREVKDTLKFINRITPSTVDLRVNIECESERITTAATELSQVLMNLCTNSIHSLANESGVVDVNLKPVTLKDDLQTRFGNMPKGCYVQLTVSDNGYGITADDMEKVFDPYFTTKGAHEGAGLGLAVVFGIVKASAGSIDISSEVGVGTTVDILFPLCVGSQVTDANLRTIIPKGSEHILFVDDEPSIVALTKKLLERQGYKVTATSSSKTALELFITNPNSFDLVITDMTMPYLAGKELAQEMLKIRSNIPIVMLTGHSNRIDSPTARQIGFKGFAYKPVDISQLATTIRDVIDNS